jgi:glycosyltransferase involved in cell wall biosynthesis
MIGTASAKQSSPANRTVSVASRKASTTLCASVIIPAYNEEQGLPLVLENVLRVLGDGYEVIVVDDGSTDSTAEIAGGFDCRVIRHDANKGKGEALRSGIAAARAEHVIWIDADDTYPAETIPEMIDALRGGADMVCASRTEGRNRIPAFNRIGNAIFGWSIRTMYGYAGNDPCTGLCAIRREAVLRMDLTGKRFTIDSEIAMKAGRMNLRVIDFPIKYRARVGSTKLNGMKDGLQIMAGILRHALWKPSKDVDSIARQGEKK